MTYIEQGLEEALRLLLRQDPEVMAVVFLTLQVSGMAALFSVVLGVPLGC